MNRHFVGREDREGQRRERMPRSASHNNPAAPGRGRPGDSKRVREAEMLSVSGRMGDDGSPARARGTDAVSRESEGSPSCDSGRTEPGRRERRRGRDITGGDAPPGRRTFGRTELMSNGDADAPWGPVARLRHQVVDRGCVRKEGSRQAARTHVTSLRCHKGGL